VVNKENNKTDTTVTINNEMSWKRENITFIKLTLHSHGGSENHEKPQSAYLVSMVLIGYLLNANQIHCHRNNPFSLTELLTDNWFCLMECGKK
jgi:hypothetical protein